MAWSEKAIEDAARQLAEADSRDFDTQSQSWKDGDKQLAKFALDAASAVDGDAQWNAAIEACAKTAADFRFHPSWQNPTDYDYGGQNMAGDIAAAIRSLKRLK